MVLILLGFKFLGFLIFILVSVAFVTLLERKVLSLVGMRLGPNKVSFIGILQPLGDALKLSNKQTNLLSNFSYMFYYFSSIFMLFSGLVLWMCFWVEPSPLSLKYSILIFMMVLGFNSLNSIISGWSTFSKYSLIGSIRTVSQLISYESVLYLCLFFIILVYGSYNFLVMDLKNLYYSFIFIPFCFYLWIPSFLAELNRTPYDFSEGESELVSGFNTEFGSKSFTLIFLAEYGNILFFCCLTAFIFFNEYVLVYSSFFFFFVIWIRSVLPRFRFDKLMMLAWTFFIPFLTLMFLLFLISVF